MALPKISITIHEVDTTVAMDILAFIQSGADIVELDTSDTSVDEDAAADLAAEEEAEAEKKAAAKAKRQEKARLKKEAEAEAARLAAEHEAEEEEDEEEDETEDMVDDEEEEDEEEQEDEEEEDEEEDESEVSLDDIRGMIAPFLKTFKTDKLGKAGLAKLLGNLPNPAVNMSTVEEEDYVELYEALQAKIEK